MPRARRIAVGGIGSPVIEAGPQDEREAVVFVHGNPGSSSDWTALVDAPASWAGGGDRHARFRPCRQAARFDYQVSAYAEFIRARSRSSGSSACISWCTTSAARSVCSGESSTRRRGRAWC